MRTITTPMAAAPRALGLLRTRSLASERTRAAPSRWRNKVENSTQSANA